MEQSGGQGERKAAGSAAPSVMKYQYDQIIKHLMLLQDHAAERMCPYSPGGEMCIRKHLMTVEAYAQETIPMEASPAYREKLQELGADARERRMEEEAVMCGEEVPFAEGLEQWARKWRKEFERHALICELRRSAEEAKGAAPPPPLPEPVAMAQG